MSNVSIFETIKQSSGYTDDSVNSTSLSLANGLIVVATSIAASPGRRGTITIKVLDDSK